MTEYATLVRPPPVDPSKSIIENALELTPLADIGPDIFTNTRPLWHPPGARGIYGGAVIAQCLSAAQLTVPSSFTAHSMHCYFVLAGNAEIPIVYHVERVREGRSFCTRTVQARQRGRPIFTTTMSFAREGSGGLKQVKHEAQMPHGLPGPWEGAGADDGGGDNPVESQRVDILNETSPNIATKRTRQWLRARGQISPSGGHGAHLSALAYMSDSYFIGTISRIHNLSSSRSRPPPGNSTTTPEPQTMANVMPPPHPNAPPSAVQLPMSPHPSTQPTVGMMVSLDHTIYFHASRESFRADEWFLTEIESPWSGDGRGVVCQKIWTQGGRLVATCFQEGVVRLKQDGGEKAPKL